MTSVREQQYLLWIDAVGGYLICPQTAVTVGQATPGNAVDVPLRADLARRHVTIMRMADRYVLEPHAATRLHDHAITETVGLRDGDEFLLNDRVALRFRQPHPLSNSARLEVVSNHRISPSVDAVILMANSCVLGPALNSHVVCRPWMEEVVLARHPQGLRCKVRGEYRIDGEPAQGLAPLTASSLVQGESFSWRLEPWRHDPASES